MRYDDLRAVVFNGTTKRSPEPSHTDGLWEIVRGIFTKVGVTIDEIRTADHEIPAGLWPDMREHGYERDEFPDIYERLVKPAHILIIAGPIWLGDQSSHTRKIIERLYAYSSDVNAAGQWSYYGKVGAAITTGNDDGGKHVSAQVLYALQHIGLTIPPQADSYWTGEAGPGPSYLDHRGRRSAQRVGDQEHRFPRVECPSPRETAHRRRRDPRLRKLNQRLGPRAAGSSEPGAPGLTARSAEGTRGGSPPTRAMVGLSAMRMDTLP